MISILMSVYNGEKYLRRSIGSILRQSYQDYEVVIVNDGSTDETSEILEMYIDQDKRFRVFHTANQGLANALNFGVTKCRHEFIARLDVDDEWDECKLQLQLEKMLSQNLDLSSTSFCVQQNKKTKIFVPSYKNSKQLHNNLWKLKPVVAHSTLMFKKEAFTKLGGYNSFFKTAEDFDLLVRAAKHLKCSALKKNLAIIHKNEDSISAQAGQVEQLSDALLSLAWSEGLIDPPNLRSHRSESSITFREAKLSLIKQSFLGKILVHSSNRPKTVHGKFMSIAQRLLFKILLRSTKRQLLRVFK